MHVNIEGYLISYRIVSYHIISYHIISYHIISYHIISYHIISYHIIPYLNVSYHIIYHIIYIISYIVSYLIIYYIIPYYNNILYYIIHTVKNLKWSIYRPGVAQRVGRVIALLFYDRGTRREWVVSSTPLPHFAPGKDPVPIVQEAVWAPGPVWTGGKSRSYRVSIQDRSARSSVAIQTELPGPHCTYSKPHKCICFGHICGWYPQGGFIQRKC